jgi:hypothetical protein
MRWGWTWPPPDHGLVLGADASESLLDAEPDREHCVSAQRGGSAKKKVPEKRYLTPFRS